ncbi:MAG TPA: hypothetical protein VN436_14425, partial [Holophaga sp.]|nr:hypothetical protein [Holophaga sp.]
MNAARLLRPACLLALACLLACTPREDRSSLARRPVAPAVENGWARLPLDGATPQSVWLGDAEGTPIPFEIEREGLWQPRQLELAHLLAGRDAKHQPSAEFTLKFPEGWQVREREHLKVDLHLSGQAPWVCRVDVDRRMQDGAFLSLERDAPLFLYDLGTAGERRSFYIPWDAQTYRVTLVPTQGTAPKLEGLSVTASTRPEELQADETISPRVEQAGEASWILRLDAPRRIVGADVLLKPPIAPIQPSFHLLPAEQGRTPDPATGTWVSTQGLVWNLPALGSRATRLALGPVLTDGLRLDLPAGARLDTIKLLARREVLLFPAETGRRYFLHAGGRVKQAPGNLAA